MRLSRLAALACALLFAAALAACGGSRGGGCGAQTIPLGPVPAGTPIPDQPLPANSGISTNAFVGIDFTINANGTVTSARIRVSSGSAVVDAAALQIVRATIFKSIDTDCEGQPVRSGYIGISFVPSP